MEDGGWRAMGLRLFATLACSTLSHPVTKKAPMKLALLLACLFTILTFAGAGFTSFSEAGELPPVSELKPVAELPDPLMMFDGAKIAGPEQWIKNRRPELIALFQHYMYGRPPAAP